MSSLKGLSFLSRYGITRGYHSFRAGKINVRKLCVPVFDVNNCQLERHKLTDGKVSSRFIRTSAPLKNELNELIYRSPFNDVVIPHNVNLAYHVMSEFSQYGDSVALEDGVTGQKYTYNQLKDAVTSVGSALVKRGFKKGDVITMFSPNVPDFAVMYLAVVAIGGTVSAVNPLYTAAELQHAVSHSESKLLVTVPALLPVAKEAAAKCPQLKETVIFGEGDNCRPFTDLLADDGKSFPDHVPCDPIEDMAALPFSSGTTGLPKAVMLTHYNIIANIEQMTSTDDVMNYTAMDDTLIAVLPFFHIYGQVVVMLSGLKKGVKIVTLPKFDPELYLKTAENHKATFLHVVPPIVLFLAKHPMVDNYDLSAAHTYFTGAAPVGADTVQQAVERLSIKAFRQAYGLTEASPVTHSNPKEGFRFDTIGHAIQNVDCKIVDIETGELLPPGKEGEICCRGPNIMKGYFKNDKATAETIKDNWLHTGDIGYVDTDGHVIVSDRLKELIKFKGFQVAPAELEALLVTHPKIADAAVIGKPDERAGELPRAYVVMKANQSMTDEEVKDFVKGKVASFKQLSGGVEFRPEIPKSASGKILRRNLKAELLDNM